MEFLEINGDKLQKVSATCNIIVHHRGMPVNSTYHDVENIELSVHFVIKSS